ncbi:uncharacterized protein [Eurosta solidaginis]|uniref:uncharacterized protein isoform X1 n=1 Tax=Eurosta solidaginis TaxID=178769 RepID=UPI0035314FFF
MVLWYRSVPDLYPAKDHHIHNTPQSLRGATLSLQQQQQQPPLVTTKYVVEDQADLLKTTALSFTLTISPMARTVKGEYEPLMSNINAVRTTLGPRSMDKHIVDCSGKATISNVGANIMKLLDIQP